MFSIFLADDPAAPSSISDIAERWQLQHDSNSPFWLGFEGDQLCLRLREQPKMGAISVDFVSGASAHRRKFGGGRGQAIAKAVGLKSGANPVVVDGTAGLGRDSFVLASLGCKVMMVERHPVVAALLEDGLRRAHADSEIGPWAQQRMQLAPGNSIEALAAISEEVEVVYLDPMYPHRAKSALVKKEMRVFQQLVGSDDDADALLAPALALAGKRVVVKRPDYADYLDNQKPTMAIETKKNRFDVYVKAAL
ncbi:class I SAM-dependent methyltransferase [Ferrimonas aestuarii]|uniref:Ribosomal RNA small subunit methyltransferase J n=1 Tax=Ferrimonas aestuarii TaxID=2569539 RepID=A0A4U1BKI2_9GAMM|nr:class I SAM-dependent methyltransferase [Ferrimonas aestuarii]TKB51753.1 16S rRNA methyltransferase [Ferrimonas aestuarii]